MKISQRKKAETKICYYEDEPKLFLCFTLERVAMEDGKCSQTIRFKKNCHVVGMDGKKICDFDEFGEKDEAGENWVKLKECSVECCENFFVVKQTIFEPENGVEKDSYKAYTYTGRLFTCKPNLFNQDERRMIERWLCARGTEKEIE